MIYLDNAATSFPKPESVYEAVYDAMKNKSGNPGRSGHKLSISAGIILDRTRFLLAKLFNVDDEKRIVFTLNATDALNLAINGFLKQGDHVITSSMEHNSVTRPLEHLKQNGIIEITKLEMNPKYGVSLEDINNSIKENTKLIVMTHASNVTGTVNPIAEIGSLCQEKNIAFLVDASQTAGTLDIDVQNMGIDLLAFPGHKGLLGPTGTGGLYISKDIELTPSRYGGTGVFSEERLQPKEMPFYYESGTQNSQSIAGLCAGLEFILDKGVEEIHAHEMSLVKKLVEGLSKIERLKIFGNDSFSASVDDRAAVVSISIFGIDCAEVATVLDTSFDIAVRAGLHCAPDAHKSIGTFGSGGTIRLSPGFFTTESEIESCVAAIAEIVAEY